MRRRARPGALIAAITALTGLALAGCGANVFPAAQATPAPHASQAPSPPSAASSQPPWVGVYSKNQGQTWQQAWSAADKLLGGGKLTYRRSFDDTIPAVGQEAWRKAKAPSNFYSAKPPHDDIPGYIAGKYDKQLKAVVRALPAGTKFTVYHEANLHMSGATYYQVTKHTVDVVKSVRPDIQVWFVSSAYGWQHDPHGYSRDITPWLNVAKIVDAVGIDDYAPSYNFKPIKDDSGFTLWWDKIVKPSDKPWGVVERGISGKRGQQARIKILQADWAFMKASHAVTFLYWDSVCGAGSCKPPGQGQDYQLTGSSEQAAFRTIAAQGRQQ